MRKLLRAGVVLVLTGGLLAVGPAAFAAGNRPEISKEIERDFTDTFVDTVCVGGTEVPATITTVEKGIFHLTSFEDGRGHVTGTFTGTFSAVPLDSSLPTYAGRYTLWFGGNSNNSVMNTTFTFAATGKGSDGSRVNFGGVFHVTADWLDFEGNADPIGVRSMVDNWRCK